MTVTGLEKTFRVPHERRGTIKERVADRLRRRPDEVLPALDDVSFDVRPGEFLGIVGRNGSGKSTLLRCIAGIYDIDRGEVAVRGRLSPFVDLGVGVDGELTGRENILLSGVLLGLTRKQVRERFDDIVAFAELEEFADSKLKNYSAGMAVRLSFAVAIQVDADVLLIDEVLAVGDASFQEKCSAEFERLKRDGRTILFVTHDMSAIERFCHRALLLEQGRVLDVGSPAAIAGRYEETVHGSRLRRLPADDIAPAPGPLPSDKRLPAGVSGGRRYRPAALGSDIRRLLTLTFTLAAADFKLHYLGSALGYLWAVMRPLMLFGVVYAVFTRVSSFAEGVENYAVYLLTSIVLWTYFAESTSGAATSLIAKQDLLRKLRFPRAAIPLSVVLKALFNLGLNLLTVAVLAVAAGLSPRLSWLELPLLLMLLVLLSVAMAMLLSALSVRYRDVPQLWTVALQLLFFGSSVLYVVTEFPGTLQRLMVANPLAMLFTEMRHALIDPAAPTAADVAGGYLPLLIPLGSIAVLLGVSFWSFGRESTRMAENL